MLAGQSFGYRAAVPSAHAREHLLASSGHDYLDYAPLILRVCAAAVTLGFIAAVIGAFFGRERWAGLQVSRDRGRSQHAPRRGSVSSLHSFEDERFRGSPLRLTVFAYGISFGLALLIGLGLTVAGLVKSPLLVAIVTP